MIESKDLLLKFIYSILVLLSLCVLAGCAGKKPVVEPAAAVDSAQEAPRDSLRAKFLLTIYEEGKTQELDAVIFSVPGKRYRMELTGPLGIGVASLLWKEEGWQMTFPTEKLYMKGVGYMVGLLNSDAIPMVHIHQVADIFDGRLLPEGYKEVEPPEDSTRMEGVTYAREKIGRLFRFAKEGGHVAWLSRMGRGGKTETIHFNDFKQFEGVDTPSRIEFDLDGEKFLEIKIKKIARNKSFSSGTWRLNIPKSFKRVGE
ncbi:hypothetical protein [Fibrobacter sp. UWB10]|uniref:hypothetical protein n=1 Tax=Fibrobacter sp. UWB10 TaxID=1896201 RepID=UPI002402EF7B|nr:hypothetical protein [Fibrobacter sp. UWB10]SMP53225.1 hypothetical protein SAMN05720465_2144 [Fibrobacter sp. UWB10]